MIIKLILFSFNLNYKLSKYNFFIKKNKVICELCVENDSYWNGSECIKCKSHCKSCSLSNYESK